jgi:hypothetical protein
MTTLPLARTACNGLDGAQAKRARPDGHAEGPKKGGGGGVPLGTNAKSKNKTLKVDQETGEIIGLDPMETRLQRFILQSVARSLFDNKGSRLNKCLRLRAAHQDVQVWKSVEHKTTHYKGLQTCGSVWRCPVCSAKIAERRRVEIRQAMDAHRAVGGCVNMLTLTCPHQLKDNLADLLSNQAKALNRFFNDRLVKAVLVEMGTVGKIKALETTHGRLSPSNNGWHPHYHLLMFQGSGVDLARFDKAQMRDWEVRLYLQWAKACKGSGLGVPSYEHGLKLDDGAEADKYMAKWGLEDEMTKGHTKKALHGETPFDLLRAIQADPGDKQAAALFIEFAKTFEGKRQLTWSKGLKKLYQVADKTDDALAAETDDKSRLLGMLTIDQWRDVLAVDGRGVVLSVAASGGWDALAAYLESIKGKGVKS